jgi:hypothetical protein
LSPHGPLMAATYSLLSQWARSPDVRVEAVGDSPVALISGRSIAGLRRGFSSRRLPALGEAVDHGSPPPTVVLLLSCHPP